MINIHASFYYADSFKKCEANQQKRFLFFYNHWFLRSCTDDCQSRAGTRQQQWQWKKKFCNLCSKYGT